MLLLCVYLKHILISMKIIRKLRVGLPTPLALAILLSMVVYLLAWLFTSPDTSKSFYAITLLEYYQRGFWDLLAFSMQMMLILVLGNVLALTPFFQRLQQLIAGVVKKATTAVFITAFFSILLGLFNWGLGLIFSSLLARAIGEHARKTGMRLNYPLLVAAAYTGMMVWHGGLSGSAPLKVAEVGHFLHDKIGVIAVGQTLFSSMNLWLNGLLLIILPLTFFLIAKYKPRIATPLQDLPLYEKPSVSFEKRGYLNTILGIALLFMAVVQFLDRGLAALNINLINLMLLAFGLLLYRNLNQFMQSVGDAIGSSGGIMIQFPIYAGIMGLMNYSGLATLFTHQLVQASTAATLPAMAFVSAAVVNFFVPSGGGQWAVQGPILMDAAAHLGASFPKTIMALAYGDELTNMIQPFWAIPLMAITGVKAKAMLPYTILIMLIGGLAMLLALQLF